MINKTLRRIFSKTLDVETSDAFISTLTRLAESQSGRETLSENLRDAVRMLNKAFDDLERVIDIRDRSLTISSREMVALTERISAQAKRQQSVLDQVRSTMHLLTGRPGSGTEDADQDLDQLVRNIDRLVRNQLNSARDLKMYFEEGLNISSVTSFKRLEAQAEASFARILGLSVKVRVFFSNHLFVKKGDVAYFTCDGQNQPCEPLDTNSIHREGFQYVNVSSTRGDGILAVLEIQFPQVASDSEDVSRIEPLLPSLATTLDNICLMQEEKRKLRLETELQTARFVQSALVPSKDAPIHTSGLDISGYYKSASECGGDWWTHFPTPDGRKIVLLGDVTGHGTASALVCALVKGYCDSFLGRPNLRLEEILGELNKVVFRIQKPTGRAMTLIALAIDASRGELTAANAGHPNPLLLRPVPRGGCQLQFLTVTGNILGIDPNARYIEKTYPFVPGDRLLAYSDGLTEFRASSGAMYGENRLCRFLRGTDPNLNPAELNRALVDNLFSFAPGSEALDDITSVIVRHNHSESKAIAG